MKKGKIYVDRETASNLAEELPIFMEENGELQMYKIEDKEIKTEISVREQEESSGDKIKGKGKQRLYETEQGESSGDKIKGKEKLYVTEQGESSKGKIEGKGKEKLQVGETDKALSFFDKELELREKISDSPLPSRTKALLMKIIRDGCQENQENKSSSSEGTKSVLYHEKSSLNLEKSIMENTSFSNEEKLKYMNWLKETTKKVNESIIGRSITTNDLDKNANREIDNSTSEKVKNNIPRSNFTYPDLANSREDVFPESTESNINKEEKYPRPMERIEATKSEFQQSKTKKIIGSALKNFKK